MNVRTFTLEQVHQDIVATRPAIVAAAQEIYDLWEGDDDPEYGSGGICDEISKAVSGIFAGKGYGVREGGQDGDDHSYVIIHNGAFAFAVDIHPEVYERGGGYNWHKIPGVEFKPEHIIFGPLIITDAFDKDELAEYQKEASHD